MKTFPRALEAIGLRQAAEFLDLLYSNRRCSDRVNTERQQIPEERHSAKDFSGRFLSDSGISLTSAKSMNTIWPSCNLDGTNQKDIFRLDYEKGQEPFKNFSQSCENAFYGPCKRDHKLNLSVQDLISRDINGIESPQNGVSMRDRSHEIYPNSGKLCPNLSIIKDSSEFNSNTNHSPRQPNGGNERKSNLTEKVIDQVGGGLGLLAKSGERNHTFPNQDECDQTLSPNRVMLKIESEVNFSKIQFRISSDASEVKIPSNDLPVFNNSGEVQVPRCGEKGLTDDQRVQPIDQSFEENDLTHESIQSTDPDFDFRMHSPEEGYFSNKDETADKESRVKQEPHFEVKQNAQSETSTEERDSDSTLDSSLDLDSSLPTTSHLCSRVQETSANSEEAVDTSIETVSSHHRQRSELSTVFQSIVKDDLDSSLEIDGLLNNPGSKAAQGNMDNDLGVIIQSGQQGIPDRSSSLVLKHDELPSAPFSRGIIISLDKAGTSVSFDERGHIIPIDEEAAGGRQGQGVFETLFRPDPRYWPKLLAAGWTKTGTRQPRQTSRYACFT